MLLYKVNKNALIAISISIILLILTALILFISYNNYSLSKIEFFSALFSLQDKSISWRGPTLLIIICAKFILLYVLSIYLVREKNQKAMLSDRKTLLWPRNFLLGLYMIIPLLLLLLLGFVLKAIKIDHLWLGLGVVDIVKPFLITFWLICICFIVFSTPFLQWFQNTSFAQRSFHSFRLVYSLFFFIIFVDLYIAGFDWNAQVNAKQARSIHESYSKPLIDYLKSDEAKFRFLRYTGTQGGSAIIGNTSRMALYAEIEDAQGYDPMVHRRYIEYARLIKPEVPFGAKDIFHNSPIHEVSLLQDPLLSMFNIKYILSRDKIDVPEYKQVKNFSGIRVYEKLDFLPRFFLIKKIYYANTKREVTDFLKKRPDISQIVVVEDEKTSSHMKILPGNPAASTIDIVKEKVNSISLKVSSKSEAMLVLSIFNDGNWVVRVNGVESKVYQANLAFMAVKLEAGINELELEYRPMSFYVGLTISLIAWVMLLIIGLFQSLRYLLLRR